MKRRDLIQLLTQHGAVFKEGAKHTKVYLNGKQTTIPRHQEIKKETAKAILEQLQVGG
ncbi:MAG: type II toxin-antitoxin system HicA family toxin [Cardiobacteriaceae bacterium]|nr:type II toxin-antitoxin system HicA family toxin [Cardiobacteriaceae bacterium]